MRCLRWFICPVLLNAPSYEGLLFLVHCELAKITDERHVSEVRQSFLDTKQLRGITLSSLKKDQCVIAGSLMKK